jgi:hypothetical protein
MTTTVTFTLTERKRIHILRELDAKQLTAREAAVTCPPIPVPHARYNHSTMWIIRGSPEGRLRKQSSGTVWLVTVVGSGSSPVLVDHYSQGMGAAGEIRTSSTVQRWCDRPAA